MNTLMIIHKFVHYDIRHVQARLPRYFYGQALQSIYTYVYLAVFMQAVHVLPVYLAVFMR